MLEIAIALIVIGLLLSPLLQLYQTRQIRAKRDADKDKIAAITLAINKFAALNRRMPIPANPTLASGTAGEGAEATILPMPAGSACLTAFTIDGVRCVPGVRNDASTPLNDPILIGTIPYRALGITAPQATDSSGMKFTYAVSRYPTELAYYNQLAGTIRIQMVLATNVAFSTTDNVLFVVIGHGPDRRGAYSRSGVATACPGGGNAASDNENCNTAALQNFLFKTRASVAGVQDNGMYVADDLRHYDDMVVFQTNIQTNALWRAQLDSGNRDNIYTNPSASVIVGGNINSDAANPWNASWLSQVGDGNKVSLKVYGGDARAYETMSRGICDTYTGSWARCMKIDDVANASSDLNKPVLCGGGTTMVRVTPEGISDANQFMDAREVCAASVAAAPNKIRVTSSTEKKTCPNGYAGFQNFGAGVSGFICRP